MLCIVANICHCYTLRMQAESFSVKFYTSILPAWRFPPRILCGRTTGNGLILPASKNTKQELNNKRPLRHVHPHLGAFIVVAGL